jgi:hypothetical protein
LTTKLRGKTSQEAKLSRSDGLKKRQNEKNYEKSNFERFDSLGFEFDSRDFSADFCSGPIRN